MMSDGDASLTHWFVSTEWLGRHLDDPRIVVVDGSWHLAVTGRNARKEYDVAHIPGAVFFDIDAIADLTNPLPHMLPTPENFAAAAGALGIDHEQEIVVYDTLGLYAAPRVWWTFRAMGAKDVVLLEGGLPKWMAEGRSVDALQVHREPRGFEARFVEGSVYDLASVRDGLDARAIQLVDARPAARFWGEAPEPRPWVKTGRIPGSLNLPSGSLIENGRLKAPEELREAFVAAGVDLKRPIVTSCGSGVNAATLNLALDVLGVPRVGLYDGSWTEWGGRDDTPIAVGRES
jgi:thiosulfate/3-mercaptopyruvate sulfurtransferase